MYMNVDRWHACPCLLNVLTIICTARQMHYNQDVLGDVSAQPQEACDDAGLHLPAAGGLPPAGKISGSGAAGPSKPAGM
jgi:hypothetical protein